MRKGHPKPVTVLEYPGVGVLKVRVMEVRETKFRFLDIREYRSPKGFSSYGIRLGARREIEFLRDVLTAVLRDQGF